MKVGNDQLVRVYGPHRDRAPTLIFDPLGDRYEIPWSDDFDHCLDTVNIVRVWVIGPKIRTPPTISRYCSSEG